MVLNVKSLCAASTLVGAAFCGSALAQVAPAPAPAPASTRACPIPPLETVRIVARTPHDPGAFTQGLLWQNGALYEGVGQVGRSEVRRVDPKTGRVLARSALPPEQFGEGLALAGRELVQLTWTSGIAHRFAAATLRPRGTFRYTGEGWGLTTLGREFIRSDGSAMLTFHDTASFAERRKLTVRFGDNPLDQLNELEAIDGLIYANVWKQDAIVAIDPASGCVVRRFDMAALVAQVPVTDEEAVLNGIAWDAKAKRLFVTGKLWPTLFEIALPARK